MVERSDTFLLIGLPTEVLDLSSKYVRRWVRFVLFARMKPGKIIYYYWTWFYDIIDMSIIHTARNVIAKSKHFRK